MPTKIKPSFKYRKKTGHYGSVFIPIQQRIQPKWLKLKILLALFAVKRYRDP
jgi:hypothetical protein